MTVSQRSDAPFRAQRWIELHNVGIEPIPPFAVVEIVDPGSQRPEMGSGYTPSDGRTVLMVRKATQDNPCATVVNGPCIIPVGEYARVGTMDDPMLALVASASYTTGTTVGVKQDSYLLEAGYCGYLIIGDYDAGTGTMRVKRWEDCPSEMMVKADECIYPGDMTKKATPMKWNALTKCWEADPYKPKITICDCNKWLLALPGECFKVEGNGCNSGASSGCYRPSFPYGLTRQVKIKEQIGPGECGKVTIIKTSKTGSDCGYPEETECEIVVCNPTKRYAGCDADEIATLHISPGECGDGTKPTCYGWLVLNPRATRALAIVNNDVCGGGEALISGVTYKDVCGWQPREDPTVAKVPIPLYVCAGKIVEISWNDCECKWELSNVQDLVLPDWILDIRCAPGGCDIQKKTLLQPYYGHFCGCSGQAEKYDSTEITFDEIDVPTGVEVTETSGGTSALTNASCADNGECGLKFSSQQFGSASISFTTTRLCLPCQKPSPEPGSPLGVGANFLTSGSAGDDVVLAGEEVDIVTGIEAGTASSGASVLTGADCGTACELSFATTALASSKLTLKMKTICVFCSTSTAADDQEGPDVLSVGAAGAPITITGTTVDVVTEMKMVTTPDESTGGGDDVDDCEDMQVGFKAKLVGKTKQICVFCSTDSGGNLSDGTDVEFPLQLDQVTVVEYIDFACDPCPELSYDVQSLWVFCPGTPAESSEGTLSCTCIDCEEESA